MSKIQQRMVPLLLTVLALFLGACGQNQNQPALRPIPTNTPLVIAPEVQDEWSQIRQAGKIVVGTSADYPPFAYYSQNFVTVGFEPALIRAIGEELGVQVEIVDIAFEGLTAALQVGQIDAAIAAISVSPARSQLVDFSDIYYVSESAILANELVSIGTIMSIEELAGYRIGVQRGTIYEDQLNDRLVKTGLMASTNLHSYVLLDNAIRDLRAGIIEVVLLDLPAAQAAAQEGGIRVVGDGIDREQYAIAFPKGAIRTREEINQALAKFRDSGQLTELATTNLSIRQDYIVAVPTPVPPTATPEPTATTAVQESAATATSVPPTATLAPPPATACLDAMKWVADLTYDDLGMAAPPVLQPGQVFIKGWRIQNIGTCTWDSSYALTFVQGNVAGSQMGGQPLTIEGTVPPGATYDLNLTLAAPIVPGVYQGFWQMRNGQRVPFGQRIWAGIQVPGAATATPAPTQTPLPGTIFTADRSRIRAGERVVFSWNVQNVSSVYFYAQGESWQDKGVGGEDRREVYPNRTTTYELRIIRKDQSVDIRQIRIDVDSVLGAPNIVRFSSDQGNQLAPNQCLNLQWDVQGTVNNVRLIRNDGVLWDGAPVRGNRQDCPPGPGNYAYTLEAYGPSGFNRSAVNVNVVQPSQPTPTWTPAPVPQPVVNSFTANPTQVNQGECTILNWSTGGSSEFIRLVRNGVVVQDGGPVNGSVQDCPSDAGAITYVLEARDNRGQVASQQVGINVAAATPVPPTPTPQPEPPVINIFNASANVIAQGECVNLMWSFYGRDLVAASVSRNGEQIAFDIAPNGSMQDCPPVTGQVTYQLQVASEFAGSTTREVAVDVQPIQAQQLPEVPPFISTFTADKQQVAVGQCVNLNWEFGGTGLAAARLLRNNEEIAMDIVSPGNYEDCLNDASLVGTIKYQVSVSSENAGPAIQEVEVTLAP